MICKEDVIVWFKELESYRRIDTMCTLLNMCLPFELRFLGTCLEELGRRDSQELRGMELRVNNPQDLAADMIACQKGEPTDKKIRRKMALYLALIRACNRTCVSEIFRTLEGWGDRDFLSMNDPDTLQELLLVYIMAANHPVFSFEQHMKCSKIFAKIKENKLVTDTSDPTNQQSSTTAQVEQNTIAGQQQQQQKDLRQLPPPHQETVPQHPIHPMHLSGQHPQLLNTGPMQVLPQATIPMSFPQAHLAKLIADGNLQQQITVDGIPYIPADSNNILAHPNATWALRSYAPPGSVLEHPPQTTSPMLSQQSSPSSSRATSPNRTPANTMLQHQQQQQQPTVRNMQSRMNVPLKNIRRSSIETTPPPINQQQLQQMMSSDVLPQNMKHLDEVINSDGQGNQLQNLIRNGFRSGQHPRLKSANFMSSQQQQQQQSPVNQHFQTIATGNIGVNNPLAFSMQNMSLNDSVGGVGHVLDTSGVIVMNSNKNAASDSGSSIGSSGDISPPETPTLVQMNVSNAVGASGGGGGGLRIANDLQQKHHQQSLSYNKQISLLRLNGRSEKVAGNGGSGSSGGVSTGSTIIYAPTTSLITAHQTVSQQQQQAQPLFSSDILSTSAAANTNPSNLMQTTMPNNNNASSATIVVNTNTNSGPNNNNMSANTVLINSPSTIGNVITSNSLILQSHQQYNNTYPYHATAAIGPSSRPPLIAHNPQGIVPPPQPGAFRLPGFQLPPNGELIYPTYHPGIPFLSGGAPPPQVALRSSNTTNVNTANVGVPPQQLQQQTSTQVPQSIQSSSQSVVPNATIASPYTTLTVNANKPVSCYNCGSQAHSGRDCTEASMDDVTRSANYKLDYSVNVSSNTSPITTVNVPNASSSGGGTGSTGGNNVPGNVESVHHHLKQHTESVNVVVTATASSSASTMSATTAQGAVNTK